MYDRNMREQFIAQTKQYQPPFHKYLFRKQSQESPLSVNILNVHPNLRLNMKSPHLHTSCIGLFDRSQWWGQ